MLNYKCIRLRNHSCTDLAWHTNVVESTVQHVINKVDTVPNQSVQLFDGLNQFKSN